MTEKEFDQKMKIWLPSLNKKSKPLPNIWIRESHKNTNKAVCSGSLQEELLWQQRLVF